MQTLGELVGATVGAGGPRVLVRCAMCECDQALVRTHADADRVLARHVGQCPANISSPGS